MKKLSVLFLVTCFLCVAAYGSYQLSPRGSLIESAKEWALQRYREGMPLSSTAFVTDSSGSIILRWQPINSTVWTRHGSGYIESVGVWINRSYVFIRRWERYDLTDPTERFQQVFGAWIDLNDWPAIECEWIERLRLLRATGGDMRVDGLPHSGMYPGESIKVSELIGAWVVFKN